MADDSKNNQQASVNEEKEIKEEAAKNKNELPDIKPGMTVRVHQKIKDVNKKGEEKERLQAFEGIVLEHKHGHEQGATITVRKISYGIGVEKIFPLKSPTIDHIEILKTAKVRRAKLGYLREHKKRLKETIVSAAK